MSILELKQRVMRLKKSEQRELQAFLIRLRHETPEWRRMISKRMRGMDTGKKVTLEALELRLKRR